MKKVTITVPQKDYAVREAMNTLRTNLQFCGDDKQVILITSSLAGEGKTQTAVDLAYAIAEMGKSVVLIGADMRKPVMEARLQVTNVDKGLSHFLSGQCVLADVLVSTNIPKMHLLLSGPIAPNPTELLETKRFQGMIDSMRKVYDYIIIDSPPLGLVVDAAIIARVCDGAVMVVESGKTKYRLARVVKEKLEYAGVPILGVVLNKVNAKKNSGYYHKYYGKNGYNGYYSQEEKTASNN